MRPAALLLGLACAAACRSAPPAPCDAGDTECIAITVPRGATLRSATDTLVAHGLVGNRFWFTLYARIRGLGGGLKSGTYGFRRGVSWGELVAALTVGRGTLVRFTVPEGLMLEEVAQLAS